MAFATSGPIGVDVSFVMDLYNRNPMLFGVLLAIAVAFAAMIGWFSLDAGLLPGQRRWRK